MTNPHTQPAPTEPKPVPEAETCPHCGHAAHEPGKCLNMASDSDCQCGTDAVREAETWLRSQCNRYINGQCTTLACMIRGAWTPGNTQDVATCEPHETILRLTQQASELSALRVDHGRLCRAINDSSDNCDEAGCDKHGHTDKCETFSPAAMLKQQQSKLDTALADRDAARKEVGRLLEVLKSVEWSRPKQEGMRECPCCHKMLYLWDEKTHTPDCRLSAALRAAPEREG